MNLLLIVFNIFFIIDLIVVIKKFFFFFGKLGILKYKLFLIFLIVNFSGICMLLVVSL